MQTLFDMMQQAGGGNAFSTMARSYGLSEHQVEQAVAALMPAFTSAWARRSPTTAAFE